MPYLSDAVSKQLRVILLTAVILCPLLAAAPAAAQVNSEDESRQREGLFAEAGLHYYFIPEVLSGLVEQKFGFHGALGYTWRGFRFSLASGYSQFSGISPLIESVSFVPLTGRFGYELPITREGSGGLSLQTDLGIGVQFSTATRYETELDFLMGRITEASATKLLAEGRLYVTYTFPFRYLGIYAGGGLDMVLETDSLVPMLLVEAGISFKPPVRFPPFKQPETDKPEKVKTKRKKIDFARQYFEFGLNVGAGFDSGFIGITDALQKNVVIDLSDFAGDNYKDGAGINTGLSTNFYINVMNISIGKGLWSFGIFADVQGDINMNVSQSMLTLIAEGNANQHDSSGGISVSGGIFTGLNLRASAQYEVWGRPLRVGVRPTIFTPVVYIPSNSGISYDLSTKKDGKEGIFVQAEGEINVYTPTSLEKMEVQNFIIGPSGFDLSLEGEYALFPFLDVGGSFNNIPFAAAALSNRMSITMAPINIESSGEELIAGDTPDFPEIDFKQTYDDSAEKSVFRPFRFDVYVRYKPFRSELLVLRPNIGFSANINKGDEKGYFNTGVEARLNLLRHMFSFYVGSSYQETIWKHRAGFIFNLRAFELSLEAALRGQTLADSFQGRGLGVNLGMCFGW